MSALDSPLEVLAFDYLRFGLLTLVNNVWTWVAVVTAAVSVWRLKASSLPGSNFPREASRPVERLVAEPASATAVVASAIVEAAKPSTVAAPSSPYLFNAEGRTSGKFTLYYDRRVEDEEEDRRDDVNGELDCQDGCVGDEKQWFGEGWWEVTMRMRMGDHMGFYRYQDLMVLDGSVVRLWDGLPAERWSK